MRNMGTKSLQHHKSLQPRRISSMLKKSLLVALALSIFAFGTYAYAEELPSFTVGVPGRSGCLVCHGDPKIQQNKTKVSLYVSQEDILQSAHKDVACTKCHVDFSQASTSQAHTAIAGDFKKTAGLACKNCHQHSGMLKVYSKSIHGRLALSGDPKGGANCADCHGSHNIKSFKKDKVYKAEFHLKGKEVCGKCHMKYYESYDDYYHGRAYKANAIDAPACWDCHGAHDVASAGNAVSMVSKERLPKTCAKCHVDASKGLVSFAPMIHGRAQAQDKNALIKMKNKVIAWFNSNVVKNVTAWAGR